MFELVAGNSIFKNKRAPSGTIYQTPLSSQEERALPVSLIDSREALPLSHPSNDAMFEFVAGNSTVKGLLWGPFTLECMVRGGAFPGP